MSFVGEIAMGIANRAKKVSPSLTLEITAKANKMKAEGIDVVSFGAGEPDFNTPDYIIAAAKTALDKGLTKYTPASGTVSVRKAICAKLKTDNNLTYEPSEIVVSNGAKHSLYNAFLAVVNAGDEVIIPAPYWLTYPELVKLCDGVPVYVDTKAENNFKMTPAELQKAITPKTKAIIFNNPSNPTGTVYTESEIKALAAVIEKTDIYVVSDEIYEKLVYDDVKFYSFAQVSDKIKSQTILVNGVSKSYSMTGWRIGYTASSKAVADAMGNMQSHTTSNPNSIAQYATAEALTNPEGLKFLSTMHAEFDARRKVITAALSKMKPLTIIIPKGAFYVMVCVKALFGKTFNGKKMETALDVAGAMLEGANCAVIPCESFGADDYIRLSYAISMDDINKGMDNIRGFLANVK